MNYADKHLQSISTVISDPTASKEKISFPCFSPPKCSKPSPLFLPPSIRLSQEIRNLFHIQNSQNGKDSARPLSEGWSCENLLHFYFPNVKFWNVSQGILLEMLAIHGLDKCTLHGIKLADGLAQRGVGNGATSSWDWSPVGFPSAWRSFPTKMIL